jgi:hypothetical protein
MFVILLCASSMAWAADSANHSFTDQQGRTLVAHIVRVVEPDVYLQSDDGLPFPVKISVFSAKDQTYIQQWASEHKKSAEPFSISALKNVLADTPGSLPQQGFNVTLKNLSGKDAVNLRVDYIVFRQPTPNSAAPLPRVNGTTSIIAIAKNREATFETDRIIAKGTRLAVWVRIYNASGTLLQEWSSAPEITKDEEWNPAAHSGDRITTD